MRPPDPLLAASSLLRPRLPRILAAIALGVLSLGSALALAGISAWLITRAWQMPPVLDLSVAVVLVRTFAISRGVLHYCERLATHDTALRAAGTARAQIYHRLAHGPAWAAVRLHSGELVARVGADVDELADVLVRALVPIGVATVLALAATVAVGVNIIPSATRRQWSPSSTHPSFVSPARYLISSPNHNVANMLGVPHSTPPPALPPSPRQCPPPRSGRVCSAQWRRGSGWHPRSHRPHWPC